jgi:hypothetical protein
MRLKVVYSVTTKPIRVDGRFHIDCLKKTTPEDNSIAPILLVGKASAAKSDELTSCLWFVQS